MKIISDFVFGFFRGFGFFALFFSYLLGFFLSNKNLVTLGNFLLIDVITNFSFKNFFKIIMGNKTYPLIGNGNRPPGALNCGFFIEKEPTNNKNYGMPSGHSQTFAFVSTLLSLHLLDVEKKYSYKHILLTILTFSAMLIRIYIEKCHTFQQTIVGSLFGIILAKILVEYYGNPFTYISH